MKSLLIACLTLLSMAAAQAEQTVWRCGADGRSYSDAPCPQGRALAIDDSRSAEQQRAAQAVAQREQALARALVQERQQRERAWRGPTMAGIKPKADPLPAQPPKAQAHPKKQASKRDAAAGTWTSTAPASPRKRG